MSTSDEMSNTGSPLFQIESPYSSPSQQVPQLVTTLNDLSCKDGLYMQGINGMGPFLKIVEQPMDHFRFRYNSEMVGTHGCLLGKNKNNIKSQKTHPTVEAVTCRGHCSYVTTASVTCSKHQAIIQLFNYSGRARIRCTLVQHNRDEEHPHKLLEEDQARDVSAIVPDQGSYRVAFQGMGIIIHTAKKDVVDGLIQKYRSNKMEAKELKLKCENIVKGIDLNIVRLKFSAFDAESGQEICRPVFSDVIKNMKSAATNQLRICRISKHYGRPFGGDDVFILVEKVNKRNIMVRFTEYSDEGKEMWSANASFLQTDVHHQYAIVFRTPAYRDKKTTKNVKVAIELVRPSDGHRSEPVFYTYTADPVHCETKKRKFHSSYSSLDSGSSLSSLSNIPIAIQTFKGNFNDDDPMLAESSINILPHVSPEYGSQNSTTLHDAIYEQITSTDSDKYCITSTGAPGLKSPMISGIQTQPNNSYPSIPSLNLNSAEFNELLNSKLPEDNKMCDEYMEIYNITDSETSLLGPMVAALRSGLYTDSGRGRKSSPKRSAVQGKTVPSTSEGAEKPAGVEKRKAPTYNYSALYKPEDGAEVKEIVKDLCELIRKKTTKKQEVRQKLERLFEMRLSNGDTFLHMTLCTNLPSMEYVVKIVHSMKMPHLLNLTNDKGQTILHLAIIHDLCEYVNLLISKGCNPMIGDDEGNTAMHTAVLHNFNMELLLDIMKHYDVPRDLDVCNSERQSPLLLAASCGAGRACAALRAAGVRAAATDAAGRTALHLAAYDHCLPVLRALLPPPRPCDIDMVDGKGNTALQIACGGELHPDTVEIVRLLLENKANPLKTEENQRSAWKMAQDKPALVAVMRPYVGEAAQEPYDPDDFDVKSEPEDEYESAEEGESCSGLSGMSSYAVEVARVLDAGGWRALSDRLHVRSAAAWCAQTASPTASLLTLLKNCDDTITSESLAQVLDDIGEHEAAEIIRAAL